MNDYIKPAYRFAEINDLLKRLTLDEKISISVEVIGEALKLSKHKVAVAFSGGKDSEVVADMIERFYPEQFQQVHCIFGNTGCEFPESLKFAREYGRAHFGQRFHETQFLQLQEDELRYEFAQKLISVLEEENALNEVLKPDGKLKGQKALVEAAKKRGYKLDHSNCFFAGHPLNFHYCLEQYGAPLLGKSASKLDAHRINIECFLKYSNSTTEKEELKEYYEILKKCKFSQHCCKLLKKEPSERLQAELDVDMIFKGLMASESHSRLTSFATRGHIFASHRAHIKDGAFYHVNPLGLWTDNDIWAYIRKYKIPYSPLYDITYEDKDGNKQRIKRNGCMFCGTDIQFQDNHLAVLRQTHPKAWQACMEKFGYREQLYTLFKIKRNKNIQDAYSNEALSQMWIERFGSSNRIFDLKPCVFDEYGDLVELDGTGLKDEYDAEVFIDDSGQLVML